VLIRLAPARIRPISAASIGLVLFSVEKNAIWVGGTTQYYALLLFSLLSLLMIYRGSTAKHLSLSLLCLFLAVNSLVAGLLVIPAALVFFMVSKEWSLVKSLIWLSVAIIILTLFFLGYNVADDKPSIFHFLTDPWFASKYALVLLSSPFATGLGYVLPMVISCLALGLIVIVAVKLGPVNYLRRPEGLAILYILILLAAVTAGQSGFEELSTATSSRYLVYTKVFWLLVIISILSLFTLKRTTQQLILGGVFMYSIINTSVATTHLGAQARQQSNALINYWFRGNAGGLKYTSRAKDAGVHWRRTLCNPSFRPYKQ